jgi:hypothetical protein
MPFAREVGWSNGGPDTAMQPNAKRKYLSFPVETLSNTTAVQSRNRFCRNNDQCVSDDLSQRIAHFVGAVLGRHLAHMSRYFSATIGDGGQISAIVVWNFASAREILA